MLRAPAQRGQPLQFVHDFADLLQGARGDGGIPLLLDADLFPGKGREQAEGRVHGLEVAVRARDVAAMAPSTVSSVQSVRGRPLRSWNRERPATMPEAADSM